MPIALVSLRLSRALPLAAAFVAVLGASSPAAASGSARFTMTEGTTWSDAEQGLSFRIPSGWTADWTTSSRVWTLRSETESGLVLVMLRRDGPEEVRTYLAGPLSLDGRSEARAAGAPVVEGAVTRQRYDVAGSDGPLWGEAVAHLTERGGLVVVAFAPSADAARLLADRMVTSVNPLDAP